MSYKFKNILYYLENNMASFKSSKINEIDALIFSYISYFHIQAPVYKQGTFDSIYIKDLNNIKYNNKMIYDSIDIESTKKLLKIISASPRFRDVQITYYIEKSSKIVEKQFSAMTFKFLDENYFIAYRGTDHSFVGWKEDLNMAFVADVPAQKEALKYLKKVADKFKGNIYVGGHSKGGNLATYAVGFIDEDNKKRVKKVYNFDGPSLNTKLMKLKNYDQTKKIIKKYVPQSSIVGMCFEKTSRYKVIKSNTIGVLQHNPFTWEVGKNTFKKEKDSTIDSKIFKRAINMLIESLTEKEIKIVIDSIYEVVKASNTSTLEQFSKDMIASIMKIFDSISKLSAEQKKIIMKAVSIYIRESVAGFFNNTVATN